MFVWTFEGVLQAIILGVIISFFGFIGLVCLFGTIKEKIQNKFKKKL